jgi:hypothetical protein
MAAGEEAVTTDDWIALGRRDPRYYRAIQCLMMQEPFLSAPFGRAWETAESIVRNDFYMIIGKELWGERWWGSWKAKP